MTIQKAEQSVGDARDRLVAIRTRLNIASEQANLEGVSEALPELDEILKSLGIAQAALLRQQARLHDTGLGLDAYGTDYSYGPSPTPTPQTSPSVP